MLINFSVENWMSFRDKTDFTMTATRESQHGERLALLKKYRMRVLPVAVVYGGNASGKTNFFKAINFARNYIERGGLPGSTIAVEPFLLNDETRKAPVEFRFEILVDEDIYEYFFSLVKTHVVEEKLTRITSSSEKVLYHRQKGEIAFHSSIKTQRARFVFEGTQDNQLYLTNSSLQKVETFQPIYRWFTESLVFIAPDTRFGNYGQFISKDSSLKKVINSILPKMDTGICHVGGEEIPIDSLQLPDKLLNQIREEVRGDLVCKLVNDNEQIVISEKDGNLVAEKFYTYHKDDKGCDVRFDYHQESDGSKRIIDLIPAFLDLVYSKTPKVYIVDEIDRSLHSLLTQTLLEFYLQSCTGNTKGQLLFTTHNLQLMDQSLFRRDEMWITQRTDDNSSQITSFSEFLDIRKDKDIRKSYLQGRMGGVPDISTANLVEPVM